MLTVKDIVSILQFGEFDDKYGKEVPRLTVSADGLATHINPENNPENKLEMAAYGDFIVDRIHVDELGVDLCVKSSLCTAGA